MTATDFEQLVEQILSTIPAEYSERFENLVFVVEPYASHAILSEAGSESPDDLLGFYRGYPLSERTSDLVMHEPDMIYLFQHPIENEAVASQVSVERVVLETVIHEVAHYFGFSEAELDYFEALWAGDKP